MDWNLATKGFFVIQIVFCSCVTSQIIMRFADGSPDEYRNVNDSCNSVKCSAGSYDYRPDQLCRRCKCMSHRETFWTETKSCEADNAFGIGKILLEFVQSSLPVSSSSYHQHRTVAHKCQGKTFSFKTKLSFSRQNFLF